MLITPSRYADRLNPSFGVPAIKPAFGETFDANNDLTLSHCGTIVHHRDGHVTYGSFRSVTSDAMIEYDRRHMTKRAFEDCYGVGDDEESSVLAMLHGDIS
jgi:hypothetical protein